MEVGSNKLAFSHLLQILLSLEGCYYLTVQDQESILKCQPLKPNFIMHGV